MKYLIIPLVLGFLAMFLFVVLSPIYYSVRTGMRTEKRKVRWLMCLIAVGITAAYSWPLSVALDFLFSPIQGAGAIGYGLSAILMVLWPVLIFRKAKNKAARLALICVSILSLAVSGKLLVDGIIDYNTPAVKESSADIWRDYNPLNEENKLAVLSEPPTLRITEDVPRLDGATALYPVYAAFANAAYPMENYAYPEDYNFLTDSENAPPENPLELSTTSRAYERLVDGDTDVIFVAGPSDEQLQYAAENGVEMVFTPIGREAFVFFVNAENPVESMTAEEIRSIYSGEITRWREVDPSLRLGKIRAYQRESGSGSQSSMIRFMGDVELMDAPSTEIIDTMGGIIDRVSSYRNHKNAIGYSFRFYSTEMVTSSQIKLLNINGIAPTKENILNCSYPISSEFYAVHLAGNKNPNIPLLLDWILSEQGQALIDQTGYVALR